ncbi:MAG: hypothetical protein ACFFCQ_04170 [Promethearchaeota archaeon]
MNEIGSTQPTLTMSHGTMLLREILTKERIVPHFLITKVSLPEPVLDQINALTEIEQTEPEEIKNLLWNLAIDFGEQIYEGLEDINIYKAIMVYLWQASLGFKTLGFASMLTNPQNSIERLCTVYYDRHFANLSALNCFQHSLKMDTRLRELGRKYHRPPVEAVYEPLTDLFDDLLQALIHELETSDQPQKILLQDLTNILVHQPGLIARNFRLRKEVEKIPLRAKKRILTIEDLKRQHRFIAALMVELLMEIDLFREIIETRF